MPEQEQETVLGRIEVVPEVLLAIAEQVVSETAGIAAMAEAPGRRGLRHEGILLDMSAQPIFDLHLIMDSESDMLAVGRAVQQSLVDAVDKMVGIPVQAVNVHIEDISYRSDGEAASP